jgi:hypothetical protein
MANFLNIAKVFLNEIKHSCQTNNGPHGPLRTLFDLKTFINSMKFLYNMFKFVFVFTILQIK